MTVNVTSVSRRINGEMYFAGSYTDGSAVGGTVPHAGLKCNFAVLTEKKERML
jgi:hypothetical protein